MLVRIDTGQVVLVEDLVLPLRDSRDGEHEPGLIWIVLLHSVDARWDLEGFEVPQQLVHQYLFAGWLDADSEDDLRLLHRKDLRPLNEEQLLLGHILAVFVGQELATSSQQFPECGDAFERGQFLRGASVYHLDLRVRY